MVKFHLWNVKGKLVLEWAEALSVLIIVQAVSFDTSVDAWNDFSESFFYHKDVYLFPNPDIQYIPVYIWFWCTLICCSYV